MIKISHFVFFTLIIFTLNTNIGFTASTVGSVDKFFAADLKKKKNKVQKVKSAASKAVKKGKTKIGKIAKSIKNNAPWGDIMTGISKSGVAGLKGCAEGVITSVPGILLTAAPTFGASGLTLFLSCGSGFVLKFGNKAVSVAMASIKTTDQLGTINKMIKSNLAYKSRLEQMITDAELFVIDHQEEIDADPSLEKSIKNSIKEALKILETLKTTIDVLKKVSEEKKKEFNLKVKK